MHQDVDISKSISQLDSGDFDVGDRIKAPGGEGVITGKQMDLLHRLLVSLTLDGKEEITVMWCDLKHVYLTGQKIKLN